MACAGVNFILFNDAGSSADNVTPRGMLCWKFSGSGRGVLQENHDVAAEFQITHARNQNYGIPGTNGRPSVELSCKQSVTKKKRTQKMIPLGSLC
jgi:hypothetical protein